MSLFEFKLPDIGEGVMEGEIVSWLVEAGQAVREDEPMVEVMTDKATVTIGAPKTGTIQELCAEVGEVVEVGAVIVTLATNGAGVSPQSGATKKHASPPAPTPPAQTPPAQTPPAQTPPAQTPPAQTPPAQTPPAQTPPAQTGATMKHAAPPPAAGPAGDDGPAATAVGDIRESLPGSGYFAAPKSAAPVEAAPARAAEHFAERPLATPATRKLARDLEVDLRYVAPSGAGGRVTQDDVRSFVAVSEAPTVVGEPSPEPRAATPATPQAKARAPIGVEAPRAEDRTLEDRAPFVGVRRKIAERMQMTKNTAAHFTFVEECDVGRLTELRTRLRPAAQEAGVKLTFLPFIVKAVVAALKKHPVLNSALDERTNELVTRRYYNIGIAAATDRGLMVPVVADADRRSLLDVAKEIDRLGTAARGGTIAPGELSGSTFTITSLGKQGGLFATPILNHPEVGILGVHQIKQRPVVRDGAIEIGEVMLLSLSFDHRIVDGHVGAAFAYDVIGYLEDPDRLFLEMT